MTASALRKAVPALALVAVSVSLWQVWVKPTFGSTASPLARPGEAQSLDGLHLRGNRTAPIGLIVFSDFECPACALLATRILPPIIDRYVDSGRVLLAFSDLPLESIHAAALRRAAIAECAAREGKFWQVHDHLFARARIATVEEESAAGLDQLKLRACLASDAYGAVRQRQKRAQALGLTSTPSLFLGQMKNGSLTVTDAIAGVRTDAELSALIDRRLSGR